MSDPKGGVAALQHQVEGVLLHRSLAQDGGFYGVVALFCRGDR